AGRSRTPVSTRAFRSRGAGAAVSSRATASIWRSSSAELQFSILNSKLIITVTTIANEQLHPPPCFRHTPFDRADGRVQHRADLFVRVVAGLRQQQRVAQFGRQRTNAPSDVAAELARDRQLLRRAVVPRMIPVLAGLGSVDRGNEPSQPAPEAAPPVDRVMPGDG